MRSVARAVRRMPNPRLTDLGCGLFCGVSMFVLACLDRLVFGASPVLYGVLFLLVSALTAMWVRRGDLASAPVVVPIAFAVGLPLLAKGEGGLGGHLMALVTALAMQAGHQPKLAHRHDDPGDERAAVQPARLHGES
uniref:DUF6542 domain-containing protein n=1 Tax=Streptomyces scabiei TaxID=1930 RepID=UPI00358FB53D